MSTIDTKHAAILSLAVEAMRSENWEAAQFYVDQSYRADVALGDNWRDRRQASMALRLALMRCMGWLMARARGERWTMSEPELAELEYERLEQLREIAEDHQVALALDAWRGAL